MGEQLFYLGGQLQIILLCDGHSLLAGAAVRIGRAGGDHVQRIAQNVGKHDGEYVRRGADLRKAAALDSGEPLADGVDLNDVRAAGQQLAGNVLQHCAFHQRLFKQRAAAAGKQEQNRVGFGEIRNQIQRGLSARKGILVRNRMAGLAALEIRDGAHDMIVFGDHNASVNALAQTVVRSLGHLPGGLAGSYQKHAAREGLSGQRAADCLVRLDGVDGGSDDGVCVSAKQFIHENPTPFRWKQAGRRYRPALALCES